MTESAWAKGMRLLASGRLIVESVHPGTGLIIARCRGDSGITYSLGYDPAKKELRCTCPARTKCAHLWALLTVVSIPESDAQRVTVGSPSRDKRPVLTPNA